MTPPTRSNCPDLGAQADHLFSCICLCVIPVGFKRLCMRDFPAVSNVARLSLPHATFALLPAHRCCCWFWLIYWLLACLADLPRFFRLWFSPANRNTHQQLACFESNHFANGLPTTLKHTHTLRAVSVCIYMTHNSVRLRLYHLEFEARLLAFIFSINIIYFYFHLLHFFLYHFQYTKAASNAISALPPFSAFINSNKIYLIQTMTATVISMLRFTTLFLLFLLSCCCCFYYHDPTLPFLLRNSPYFACLWFIMIYVRNILMRDLWFWH